MWAEELLINKLYSFYHKYRDAIKGLLMLMNDINHYVMIKLKATYTNDARIQLEAVSLPPIDEIYKESSQKIEEYLYTLKVVKKELSKLYKLIEENKVDCPRCDGKGSIYKREYYREKGVVTPYIRSEKCNLCGGAGYLVLDSDFAHSLRLYLKLLLNIFEYLYLFNENENE